MNTLSIIFSVLGTICICTPPLLKGKDMKLILLLVFGSNVFMALSYTLTGAFNGVVSCSVGAVQTIINYFFERKNKPLPIWLIVTYAVVFAAVNVLAFAKITDIFALLACLAFVMSIGQKTGKQYRVWTLTNAVFWVAYDFTSFSFGPFATHLLQLGIAVCGMILHDRKKEKTEAV